MKGDRMKAVGFVIAAALAGEVWACNGLVVGRKVSATGRVIVAHNEDNLPKHRVRHAMLPAGAPLFDEPGHVRIPQTERTYACFWSEVKSDDGEPRPGDLFYNENGVMVYSNNGGVYEEWDGQRYSLPDEGFYSQCVDGGLGINLRFAVAQRARTAAEGVSIMTNLVMTYGYAPLSRIFTIADRNEAWLVQVVRGRRFVARRCPDDEVAVYPNCLTIGRIRQGDICSPGIEAKRDSFDFMAAYQGPRTWKSPFNIHRWLDFYRISAGADLTVGEAYPFSVKPAHRVSVDDIKRGLRSHYEGTPHEIAGRHPAKGPKVVEPICRRTTLESMVCVFGAKPSEDVVHLAVGRPCEVPYETSRPFGGAVPGDAVTGAEALQRLERHYLKESGQALFDGWYADPQIRRYGETYWIYPTCSREYAEQTFFDAFSSKDLRTWTKHARILTTNEIGWARGCLWAPDAQEDNGKYYLFFSANDAYPVGGKRSEGEPQTEPGLAKYGGIGVAVADRPEGPYRDAIGRPLVDRFWNAAQPIDQYVFRYKDDWYMVYGGWGRCNLVKLASDFRSLVPLEDGRMWRDLTPPEYKEGSVMFERKGLWYFMYSSGSWTDDSYRVNYCTARTPFGPFEFKGSVLGSQRPLATGAGHHSVVCVPGTDEWYICYHRRPIPNLSPHHRVTCLDRLHFNPDGSIRPVVMTDVAGAAEHML